MSEVDRLIRVNDLLEPFMCSEQVKSDTALRVEYAWLACARLRGWAPRGPLFDRMVMRVFERTLNDHANGFRGVF